MTDGGYFAGKAVTITESFELKESAGAAATALVTRKMMFRAGGYDCDMDIRLPAPVQFWDFFWGMAQTIEDIAAENKLMGAIKGFSITVLTAAAYAALDPKAPNTAYLIKG